MEQNTLQAVLDQKTKEAHCYDAPKLARNFKMKGTYVVPDLIDPRTGKRGITVPFKWNAKNGDVQMIAGGEKYPIHFTNLIYKGHLYTYTYKWPGLQPEFLPPLEECKPLFKISLDDFNKFLAGSYFVGQEILQGKCCEDNKYVNHFRMGVALPQFPSGFYPRLPILSFDIYADQEDPYKIWKVLHYGLQNIYDPDLDEWIVIDKIKFKPGKVELPCACK